MDNQVLLDTIKIGDIKGEFFVSSYQRGYRWGTEEVTKLLDDVYQNGKSRKYYLQPVVVRREGNRYELIDGQQRLTTIYLIYRYMKNVNPFFGEPTFRLTYKTREESADFLQNIDLAKRDENIDYWFIANAYETIKNWFEEDLQIRVMHIFEYFKEDVKIIWYEVDESEDAISLFTRLNIGKIPLTSAELVKAMFLNRHAAENIDYERQKEISLQWDNMEKELHNESLWYFLVNKADGRYQTRIDLILDLIAGKTSAAREKYYTFFKIDEMRKEKSLEDIWRKIQRTFLILKDWHENHTLYHKIGYLIASETLSLQEIFALSDNKTKNEFYSLLDGYIKKSIAISGNYAELSYDKPLEYKKISTLLLLFNVESVRQNGEHTQWFPFDKYKFSKGSKVTWSLEHIHAQQSEGMRTQETWKEWLKLHIDSVAIVGKEPDDLIVEMQAAIAKEKLERVEFDLLQKKVTELLSAAGSREYMHSIKYIVCTNDSYLLRSNGDETLLTTISIAQNNEGIDTEDRIIKLKNYIETI